MQGQVYWITGLSAAGKSSVAQRLVDRMVAAGRRPVLLDGDVLRAIFGVSGAHDRGSRLNLALQYARLCSELSRQGHTVICATISLFHQVHDWNRANIPGYHEIYLRVPIEQLQARDPKGIYARAKAGEVKDVAGLDFAIEEPRAPDLLIDNHGDITPEDAVAQILRKFPIRR
ncbi:adenylyl-sulfate kinase [Dongia sp.]|uniref:adenylyl-sulfate kinase n=1 Tax=Dongia sp. TaxID=1977262 RepID=UPI0037513787